MIPVLPASGFSASHRQPHWTICVGIGGNLHSGRTLPFQTLLSGGWEPPPPTPDPAPQKADNAQLLPWSCSRPYLQGIWDLVVLLPHEASPPFRRVTWELHSDLLFIKSGLINSVWFFLLHRQRIPSNWGSNSYKGHHVLLCLWDDIRCVFGPEVTSFIKNPSPPTPWQN